MAGCHFRDPERRRHWLHSLSLVLSICICTVFVFPFSPVLFLSYFCLSLLLKILFLVSFCFISFYFFLKKKDREVSMKSIKVESKISAQH